MRIELSQRRNEGAGVGNPFQFREYWIQQENTGFAWQVAKRQSTDRFITKVDVHVLSGGEVPVFVPGLIGKAIDLIGPSVFEGALDGALE